MCTGCATFSPSWGKCQSSVHTHTHTHTRTYKISRNTRYTRVQRACRPISIAWNLKRPQPKRTGIRFRPVRARISNRYPINDDTRKNNNNERWPRMQEQPSGKYFLSGWLAVDWEPTWKLRIYPPLLSRFTRVVSRGTINETTRKGIAYAIPFSLPSTMYTSEWEGRWKKGWDGGGYRATLLSPLPARWPIEADGGRNLIIFEQTRLHH